MLHILNKTLSHYPEEMVAFMSTKVVSANTFKELEVNFQNTICGLDLFISRQHRSIVRASLSSHHQARADKFIWFIAARIKL
jgi:hypothetical protein